MDKTLQWLLEGDVSLQFQTHKTLLHSSREILDQLQASIPKEGFGARFLVQQHDNGHWGAYYYQPKWTSTHYTLIDLKNLGAPKSLVPCRKIIKRMFDECLTAYGGLNLSKSDIPSDICVDGMILDYSAYFCSDEPRISHLIDHLLGVQKTDGGFTWDIRVDKSDPHTTICILEGLAQCGEANIAYRSDEIKAARNKALEFFLSNGLFINSPDERFRKLAFPYRYRYDLLRILEYFANNEIPFDERMKPAFDWLLHKQKPDGLWNLELIHPGNVHFQMEELKGPSRFITQKALNILRWFSYQTEKNKTIQLDW